LRLLGRGPAGRAAFAWEKQKLDIAFARQRARGPRGTAATVGMPNRRKSDFGLHLSGALQGAAVGKKLGLAFARPRARGARGTAATV
jgi:hypothetical protein